MPVRVAVLDDYQGIAVASGPWASLGDAVQVEAFTDHIADDAELAARLAPYEVVVAMRERTPFTAARLAALPNLRLLVTTGMANASIDLAAAHERGIVVCGTASLPSPTAELAWGLILALLRHIPAEDRADAGGRLAAHDRARARGTDARAARPRAARPPDGRDRPGVRDGR